jgi:hydroxymethylpyrimidine pyrophosphatase-like HAD family hydrolase
MRYFCLTCDYDGTIARDGKVAASTVAALKQVAASGRRLILATGRELNDLLAVFPDVSLFDRVVAENGGLLYRPATQETKLLSAAPPAEFVEELRRRGVKPLSVGQSIVGNGTTVCRRHRAGSASSTHSKALHRPGVSAPRPVATLKEKEIRLHRSLRKS